MAYTSTNWENLPSTNTPINATNLNKIETELGKNDEQVIFRNIEAGEIAVNAGDTAFKNFTTEAITGYTLVAVTLYYVSGASNAYCTVSATTSGTLTVHNGASSSTTVNVRLRAIYIKS